MIGRLKSNKSVLIFFAVIILIASIFIYNERKTQLSSDGEILSYLTLELKDKVSYETIDFSDMLKFEWSSMFIIPPYSDLKTIKTKHGVNGTENISTNIKTNDSFSLLIFTNEKNIVKYCEVPRDIVDFSNSITGIVEYKKNDSIFIFKKNANGWKELAHN